MRKECSPLSSLSSSNPHFSLKPFRAETKHIIPCPAQHYPLSSMLNHHHRKREALTDTLTNFNHSSSALPSSRYLSQTSPRHDPRRLRPALRCDERAMAACYQFKGHYITAVSLLSLLLHSSFPSFLSLVPSFSLPLCLEPVYLLPYFITVLIYLSTLSHTRTPHYVRRSQLILEWEKGSLRRRTTRCRSAY